MTIDKSLKIKAGSGAARNVYTRAERIEKLKEMEKFDESGNIYGLPKVRVVKISLKKKKKAKVEESDDACLLYTSPSPRDQRGSRMPSSA